MSDSENIQLTASNYRKSVTSETFLGWVNKAWDDIESSSLDNSFNKIQDGLDSIENEIRNRIII